MELQHVEEVVHVDAVNVAVGESSHVNHRLSQTGLLPPRVSTDVILPEEGEDLSVLHHLQGPGHDEDEVRDTLALPDDEVPRGAVGHPEVGGEGTETAVTGQPEGRVTVENSPGTSVHFTNIRRLFVSFGNITPRALKQFPEAE